MIETIMSWLENLIETFGPLGVGFATFIESIFIPLPSEFILITAGAMITSPQELVLYILLSTIGSYLGTLVFYSIGFKSRDFAYKFIEKYGKFLLLQKTDIERAEYEFTKRGRLFIFFGRLIPTIRSIISFPAGISKMNFTTYTVLTITGSFLWNTALLVSGYVFKNEYQKIIEFISKYEKLVLVILFICILVFVFKKYTNNNKRIPEQKS